MGIILVTSILLSVMDENTSWTYITIVYTFRLVGTGLSMMPLTTFAMNALKDHLLPHGTSINNTMRQIGGSLFTALLITVMTGFAFSASGGDAPSVGEEIAGVNMSFMVSAVLAFIGLVMAFFLKEQKYIKADEQ